MRDRWRLLAAPLVVLSAAGILAAVALAVPAISIDSVAAQSNGTTITTGPNGAGYDIRIQADVTDTRWESTSWSIGGVTRCVNHEDEDAGSNREVTLKYEYESNPALKAAEGAPTGDLPDPGKVGPSEHVFPPPVGDTSQLRVELFNNDSCNGTALAGRNIALTTNVPGTNKPLTAACQGLKVAVILDESGSIGNAAPQVRNATKALARGLVDTGARMAVFKFSTTADPSFIAPYKTITQAWIDGNNPGDLDYYLDRYQPGGTTNWDAGLRQARDQTASDKPDLVVFLTDGNPNRWAGGGTGVEEGYYAAMNPAANVADELKLNSHMFAIGVGVGVTDALSALRIQAVSGIRSFPEYSIDTADYTLITDFSKLEEALADLASNLCNVTVTVKKETDELVRDAWVYKNSWRFSGRVEAPPGQFNYQWYEPNRVTSVNSGNATQSGNTIVDGTIDFVWRPSSHTTLSNINISETLQTGFEPEEVTCTSAGVTIFHSDVPATVAAFTLSGLKVRDHVYCVVRNRFKRSTVQVVKQWVGDPASATIFVDANGVAPYDASRNATASGQSTSFDYPVSTPVTVGETAVPAGYTATIQCGGATPQPYTGGAFPVTSPPEDGGTVTCTITNIQNRSTVRVIKQWEGAPASATIFVDRTGDQPFDASTVATTSGQSASFMYPTSTPVTVGEVAVPGGYSATIHCGTGTPQPYAGGPFAVTAPALPNATLTCTITNKQLFSTVEVVKRWVGAPATTTIFVDQTGAPPFDAQVVNPADGDSASFRYPVSTPVTVGETPLPAGYAATISCGGASPVPYTGGPFAVTSPAAGNATVTCTITNRQQFSTVRVVKQWEGAPAATTIFVDQTGVAPFDASVVNPADGASASFDYPVSIGVTVGETTVPTGYSATIDCGAGPQAYTGGPFAVTSPAQNGGILTCTITNTQLFSTVQVVKQWSGPTASATIFVDLDGVAPFDASTIATTSGANVSFDYPLATGAFVGETAVPTGYTATIQCGGGAPVAYTGGPFAVTSPATAGATLTCTISNNVIPPPATVRVIKQWDGAPASTTIFVDQNGTTPFDASTLATADGDNTSFDYVAGTAVTVGETPVPTGYAATIQCGGGAVQPFTGAPFPVTAPAAGTTLTCTITNRQLLSTVQIVKQWDGAPASTTIFVDQDGGAPYQASTVATADGDSASFVYPISTATNVGETPIPAGYSATISCGGAAAVPYTGGAFPVTSPVTDGETLTCTITNKQQFSTVRVVKVWEGAPSSATIFVDQNGTAPFDASTVATATGDHASFDYPVGTPVTVGEVAVPAGYSATIHCGPTREAPQPYAGGPFPVTSPPVDGATLTCTITNTQLFSTVRVVKAWIGDPATTTIFVDQDGAAPFDASTVATATGDSASFEYPVSTPVFVGETSVPAGYSATIHCGPTREAPQPYTGGPFPVTSPLEGGATVTCTIINTQQRSTVRVVKDWAGGASSATLFVDANGAAPFDASIVATASGQGTSHEYAVSTPVTVGETGVPTGYTATIDCGGGPQAYTGGPFPVTSPAVDGATLTCTIINTPQATVRLQKNWAGRPSTTTIFVDAVGQEPFDVSTLAFADGQSVSFDYPLSTPVTVGEVMRPSGFRSFINCGTGPQDLRRYAGGPHTVVSPNVPNGVLTCTITNARPVSVPGRLVIVKTAQPRVVRAPARINFRMKVTNRGPGIVRNVRVCDRVPNGLIVLRAPGARRVNGSLCWQIRVLRPRASRNYLVVARVVKTNAGTYVNVVTVSGTNSVNCQTPAFVARRQRVQAGCHARARVVVLPARKRAAPRPPFTG